MYFNKDGIWTKQELFDFFPKEVEGDFASVLINGRV
jgi:hypothetical protein